MPSRLDALRAGHADSEARDHGYTVVPNADLAALLAVAEAAADLDPCETLGGWYCLTHHTQIPCGGDRLREAVAALTTKEID